jgi:hypothetical protein
VRGYRCSRRERRPRDIETIFEELVKKRTDGLLVTPRSVVVRSGVQLAADQVRLVIDLQTARALSLVVPPTLLARAATR